MTSFSFFFIRNIENVYKIYSMIGKVTTMKILNEIMYQMNMKSNAVIAVAAADDEDIIHVVCEALRRSLATFILFGNETRINQLLEEQSFQKDIQVIHCNTSKEACVMATQFVAENRANVLMKGNVSTSIILKEVLNKENNLRTGNLLSQVAIFEVDGFNKPIFVTDAAMNIKPNLEQKVQIIENAVLVANKLGIAIPKVAPLAAVEVVNSAMEATTDAALLTQMNRRGQIKNCIVDGPLALDNAISEFAAKKKGIVSEVAGKADVLLAPNIEVANVLYKSLVYFANAKVASVLSGAKIPVVLTSRADSIESKLSSISLAICTANMKGVDHNGITILHGEI